MTETNDLSKLASKANGLYNSVTTNTTSITTISVSNISANGSTGTNGQVLLSNGSEMYWGAFTSVGEAGGSIITNKTTANTSYTFPSGTNGFSVGPITLANGVTVTVSSGQRWVVI